MPTESAAHRLTFLDTEEFGTTATYTLSAGGASTIQGIFDAEFKEVVADEFGVGVGVHPPGFTMRATDLPSGYGDSDTLTVAAVVYTLRTHETDGTGLVAHGVAASPRPARCRTLPSPATA